MMTNRLYRLVMLLSLGLLTACGGAAAPPTPTPTPIQIESTSAEPEGTRRFVVVSEASTAAYVVNEEFFAGALAKYGIDPGKTEVIGSTQAIQGELRFNLADPANALVAGRFAVNLPSLATTRSQRDEWIRDNALESNKYPTAQFIATAIENAPTSYTDGEEVTFQLVGDLTIRDVTNSTTFTVTATLEGDTLSGVATTNILMTDFGFDPPEIVGFMKSENDVLVTLQFVARE